MINRKRVVVTGFTVESLRRTKNFTAEKEEDPERKRLMV